MSWHDLEIMKIDGMSEYFRYHEEIFGVRTEVFCFLEYHWGQWNLGKFKYGDRGA